MTKMNKADAKILQAIYTALEGIASERGVEFFDRFYAGGGEKMCRDFEGVLERNCGIKFVEPQYKAEPMTEKKFVGCWKITDQTGTPVLTGLPSKEEAERIIKEVICDNN